jgi:hypothetical protein
VYYPDEELPLNDLIFVRNNIEAETQTGLLDPISFQDLDPLVCNVHILEEASTKTDTSKKEMYATTGTSKKISINTGTAMLVRQKMVFRICF